MLGDKSLIPIIKRDESVSQTRAIEANYGYIVIRVTLLSLYKCIGIDKISLIDP